MALATILATACLPSDRTAPAAEVGAAGRSPFYVKRATWPETVTASRGRYAAWWRQQLGGVRLGPWHTTDRKDELRLALPVDLQATDGQGKRLWQVRHDLLDGWVHCDLSNHGINEQRKLPVCQDGEPVTYTPPPQPVDSPAPSNLCQVRTIEAQRPTTVTAWLGAEYGLEVWLNGKRLFSKAALGNGLSPQPDQAKVELPLAAGKNQLVLRLLGHRWSGFYFSIVPHARIDPDPIHALLSDMQRDFPVATRRMQADVGLEPMVAWFRHPGQGKLLGRLAAAAVAGLGDQCQALQAKLRKLRDRERIEDSRPPLELLIEYARAARFRKAHTDLQLVNFEALRLAVEDLAQTFAKRYTRGGQYLRRADAYEKRLPEIQKALQQGDERAVGEVAEIVAFQRTALLANPLLDFDKLLVIKRKPWGDPRRAKGPNRGMGEFLGLPQQSAWQLDRIRQPYGWENEIAVLSDLRAASPGNTSSCLTPTLTTLYQPPTPRLISDIDLDYDAGKLTFSMPGSNYLWQIFEIDADGRNTRQISAGDQPDVHNFDGCYLPNGKIAFVSTAPMQGVPCSNGIAVAVAYRMDADGRNVRQLCFDQDHDHCPTVLNDGRILYLRWDYTDLPHQWPRILFSMNPDGTGQREYYGSNSYWPNAVFFARPIPGHPTKIVGIVTGHHVGRVGELVIFDPAVGRHEAGGVVQRIPGRGRKVEPIIMDKLTMDSWPKFSHPYPLSEKYFIVSCKPTPGALWGIYLVDTFDNLVLLKEVEGYALFEAMALRKTKRPPVIPERIDPQRRDAIMYVEDVYQGPGLRGVPRGTVKRLRLFAYNFAYQYKSGGQHRVGSDGPWEPKRILGTVPVEKDGSAMFRVPARTPISIQPLDAEGKAVQLMRSWTTAMPGELVSCVGCHDDQNSAPPSYGAIAALRKPSEIEPWYGPARGFSFQRDVQPMLDKHCIACHDGKQRHHGKTIANLRGDQDAMVVLASNDPKPKLIRGAAKEDLVQKYSGVFQPSYFALRRHVRVGGLESDLHLLKPGEFHADTTELVQMLEKGHHGVKLDEEAWSRLTTWIDLNAPCHGTWREVLGLTKTESDHGRRLNLRKLYGGVEEDYEAIAAMPPPTVQSIHPPPPPKPPATAIECPGWPFDSAEAQRRQAAAAATQRTIDLGGGVRMELVLIPAGQFVMGDSRGCGDEWPLARVKIDKPFWTGCFEVTNRQYARFDPSHDSRHEHGTASFNSERAIGPPLNGPRQPVVRISWLQAVAFCGWLSEQIGEEVTLPTESQWEYACRAGSAEPFFYGDLQTDFSPFANMADATINDWATYNERRRSADQVPRDARFDDHALVTAEVGRYRPNAWGLHDVHGNVWEWVRSTYRPYPYRGDNGRNQPGDVGRKVVRGGSWYDRPKRCRSAFRLSYPKWRQVFNVGFRVVCEIAEPDRVLARGPAARPRVPVDSR